MISYCRTLSIEFKSPSPLTYPLILSFDVMFISSKLILRAQLDFHTFPTSYVRATFFVTPLIRAFFEASYKSIESDNSVKEFAPLSAGLKMMFGHSRLAIDEWSHFQWTSYEYRTPRIVLACESGKLVPL